MTYTDFKDLPRRTASDKVLHDKAFNIAKNPKFDEYQHGIASVVHKFFDKKSSATCARSETFGTQIKFAGANTPGVAVTRDWSETLQSEISATRDMRDKSAIKSETISNQRPLDLATQKLPN